MKIKIIYECFECKVKQTFDEAHLQEYIDFDKIHHNHEGYVFIEKLGDKYGKNFDKTFIKSFIGDLNGTK